MPGAASFKSCRAGGFLVFQCFVYRPWPAFVRSFVASQTSVTVGSLPAAVSDFSAFACSCNGHHVIHLSFVFLSTVMLMFQTSPLEFGLPKSATRARKSRFRFVSVSRNASSFGGACFSEVSLDSLWIGSMFDWSLCSTLALRSRDLISKAYGFYGSMFYTRYTNFNRGELSAMGLLSICERLLPFFGLFLLPLEFAPEVPPFAVLVLLGLLLRLPRMQLNTL